MGRMFLGCSEQFQNKIRAEYTNIEEIAFKDEDEYDYFHFDDSDDSDYSY